MSDTEYNRTTPRVIVRRDDLDHVIQHVQKDALRPPDIDVVIARLREANSRHWWPAIEQRIAQLQSEPLLLENARNNPGNTTLGAAIWIAEEKKRPRWAYESEIEEAVWHIVHPKE